jgi:TonB-linked SusC/RagA family outer membrane protein
MKYLYTGLASLLFLFCVRGYGVAQSDEQLTLAEALKAIQKAYDVYFLYEASNLQGKYVPGSMLVLSGSVEEVLKPVLAPFRFRYEKINSNTYVVAPDRNDQVMDTGSGAAFPGAPAVSELSASRSSGGLIRQPVKGKVTLREEGDAGVPGVNIYVKGTSIGTFTAIDGTYAIEVPGGESVLVFSFIGYKTMEEVVGQRSVIDVALEQDITTLGEVVVTAMGLEADKRQLAYSIQNVNTEQIANAREANLVSALSGKVAGVQVTSSSGAPGASAAIRIRGNKSFRDTNSQLFVVDGVPVDNGISGNGSTGVDVSNRAIDFNSMDIESMSVLKGPAATALYGIRAANGAVVITTKRGKKSAPVITLTSSYSLDQVNKLPPRQSLYAQGAPSGGAYAYIDPGTSSSANINSWGPLISALEFSNETPYPYDKNGRLVPKGTGNGIPAKAYDPYETFFVNGHTLDHNLSVSGGSDLVKYYVSAAKLDQTGVVPNATFQRTSFRSNVDVNLSPRFTLGTSAMFVNSGGDRVLRGNMVSGVMSGVLRTTPTFDIGNGLRGHNAANDPSTYLLGNGEQRAFAWNASTSNVKYDNPFFTVNRAPWRDNVNRFMGSFSLGYELLRGVRVQYKVGLDHFTDRRNSAIDVNSASEPYGTISQSVRTNTDINSDLLLLIQKHLNESLEFNATVGHNFFSTNFNTQSSSGQELVVPGFYNIVNAKTVTSSESQTRRKVAGLYADIKLSYKDFLLLNLSGRNDWSSTLPKSNNSFFYPAISAGVVISELLELPAQHLLSYAKLRASFGQAGNDASIYATGTYYDGAVLDGDDILGGVNFPAYGTTAFERSSVLGNNKLKAELSTTYEAGADLKFLNGRLGVDITAYKIVSDNQIVSALVAAPSGYTSYRKNAGTIENKGLEIVLSGMPVETGGFSWEITVNFTRNRNIVTDVPDDVESISLASFTGLSSLIVEGQPYGVLYGTRYRRNDAGRLIIGNDGWPVIDGVQGVVGDPNPDWLSGITNTLAYKNLSFSFLWDIRKGGDIWNGTRGFLNYLGISKETGEQRGIENFVYDGVTAEGQVNTTPVDFANPVNGLTGIRWRRSGTYGVAEDVIEDGSWLRLRNVSLSYNFPKFRVANLLSGAKLTMYARNLLLFTKYTGIDPETNLRGASSDAGWDYFNMPNTKSFGATLQFTLK